MDVFKDFADLCSLLTAKSVEFLVVGGYAVAFYGAPRYTGDLDLLIAPDPDNVDRAIQAIRDFGYPTGDLSADYLLSQRKIVQLGHVPIQIHIMTAISGVGWAEAWASREAGKYAGVAVYFIGRNALLTNKLASGRPKDRADVEALERRGRR